MLSRIFLAAASASFCIAALAADPPGNTVLVKKGDVTVTVDDFLAAMSKVPEEQRTAYRADVERITKAVSSLYVNRELAVQARAEGLDKDKDFQLRLKLAEEGMLAQAYLDKFEKSIVYPDFEAKAKEIYTANPERYAIPASVTLKHILVSFQGRTEDEAKRRAEEARAKLVAGEPFVKIARAYSNDPMLRTNDGFKQGAYNLFPPALAAAAKTAELKTPSELIRTADGFNIIIVEERLPAYTVPFEKAKRELVSAEQSKYRIARIDEKLASITKSKDVVLYPEQISALKLEVDREGLKALHEDKIRRDAEEKARIIRDAAKKSAGS